MTLVNSHTGVVILLWMLGHGQILVFMHTSGTLLGQRNNPAANLHHELLKKLRVKLVLVVKGVSAS